ncbi:MAG: hypothetical protein WCI05_04690 [Myxococcales bacterium]
MSLDLRDCTFAGPAMPEPFVKYRLEELLTKKKLLGKSTGDKTLQESWQAYRNKLRSLGEQGLEQRVLHHVLEPLVERLGWQLLDKADPATTREGQEAGGYLLRIAPSQGETDAPHLRAWVYPVGTDLDAPNKRGRAYRFSPGLVAQRVLLAKGERVGLLTDGLELRMLLSDPSGRDSHIGIRLDRSGGWRAARELPDSFRLLRALCQPSAAGVIAELLNEARLSQSTVTKKLREQARRAVETFIQGLLDDPANRELRNQWSADDEAAKELWREGLVLVYRLLFILKLETSPDPARAFSFASSSLWRNSFSPSTALAPIVEKVRDRGAETGEFLAYSLRALFRLFSHGLMSNELHVSPLGGMLFGKEATTKLDTLHWSEQAVAHLLDALLWTPKKTSRGADAGRERVHYGALDVEDLGRVYEALLELEPGIASEPMCRLRRAKLEVVVPVAQGAPYRATVAEEGDEDEDDEDDGKTKVVFVDEIPEGRFYLRVGLGRKASGSYYTPHPFVRFLVLETLGPQVVERSPQDNPNPLAILGLKVLDPAMGSGHFLVEVCRFLGDALYEACRLCDERALEAQKQGDSERARLLWKRVEDLPDPNDELAAYLPSRVLEGEESGLSQRKALALCRRLVAVHCLYGVDKNPLAVELARVSLWLESYAEGLPLTFLEHRLVCGDSLTGPFFEHLLTYPGTGERINNLFAQGVTEKLTKVLGEALVHVRDLEATIGKDVADIELKKIAKRKLDGSLQPLKVLAAAWAGGVMLGKDACDDAGYEHLLRSIAQKEDPDGPASSRPGVAEMVRAGMEGVAYDLVFPEVFYPDGRAERSGGFHAVVGNPPWDSVQPYGAEFFAAFDLRVLDAPTKKERSEVEKRLSEDPQVATAFRRYLSSFDATKRILGRCFSHVNRTASGAPSGAVLDVWQPFAERGLLVLRQQGRVGLVLPSAFHANQGATGLRELYLTQARMEACFSFENRAKLFEIDSRFKFAAVVAARDDLGTRELACGFYLHDLEWLAGIRDGLTYTRAFMEATGGTDLTLVELRSHVDVSVATACFRSREKFSGLLVRLDIRLGRELHMTDDAYRFTSAGEVSVSDSRDPEVAGSLRSRGYLPLHEGKTFHQYNDHWGDPPRYLVALDAVRDKPMWTGPARFFRIAFRDIASSTNERTGIFCLLPPGVLFGNTAPVEREPEKRPNARALLLEAVANSFPLDWHIRQKAAAHVNLFILNGCPVPQLGELQERTLSHLALRLSCNHDGYAPLWFEQLGDHWREPTAKGTWPVLEGDEARWSVRAAIDAVVAEAYGLDRGQYRHVLSSFSHRSYPRGPELCVAAFDELQELGVEAFVKMRDPYWDIPLVATLPKAVIELPGGEVGTLGGFQLEPEEGKAKRKRGKKGA